MLVSVGACTGFFSSLGLPRRPQLVNVRPRTGTPNLSLYDEYRAKVTGETVVSSTEGPSTEEATMQTIKLYDDLYEEYRAKLTKQTVDEAGPPVEAIPTPQPLGTNMIAPDDLYDKYRSQLSEKTVVGVLPIPPPLDMTTMAPLFAPMDSSEGPTRPPRTTVPKPAMVQPSMRDVMRDASDLLSHQAIMENFVHHNPWESLQSLEWEEALEQIEKKASYMSPGERFATRVPLDPRIRANEAIAEIAAPYLDRGLAKWEAPDRRRGFLNFFARTEGLGMAPWRKRARRAAKEITKRMDTFDDERDDLDELAAEILRENLKVLEPNPKLWTQTTRAMMLDLPGAPPPPSTW